MHHVAQKLKMTTLPARSFVLMVCPSSVFIVSSGIAFGFFTKRTRALPLAPVVPVDELSCSPTDCVYRTAKKPPTPSPSTMSAPINVLMFIDISQRRPPASAGRFGQRLRQIRCEVLAGIHKSILLNFILLVV